MRDESFAELTPGHLRLIALSVLGRALRALSMSDDSGAAIFHREPPPLLRLQTEEEQAAELRTLANRVHEDRPLLRQKLAPTNLLIQQILNTTDVANALKRLDEARDLAATLLNRKDSSPSGQGKYKSKIAGERLRLEGSTRFSPGSDIKEALDHDLEEQRFVASVMQMCLEHRSEGRDFSAQDELALETAYRLLDEGVRMPRNYQAILTDDARTIQTYLSFADPGDGHLAVTVRDPKLLDGLIVHIEYIDRDNVDSRQLVEAYRLPAIRKAARVRLHIGNSTPCTAFIGRPVFEGNFEDGLLKAGHTMASVCSGMFVHGIADCKVAMDGMTAAQAVKFMKVVAGNVIRDPLKQRLSAAFNINSPLVNDLASRGTPQEITDRFEIAKLAVRMVTEGGFNKVAWDGASNTQPSEPIIGQLSRVQLLKVTHAAHEHGLETYISAGMAVKHMWDAVFIGVGGVGIGTSLHHKTDGVIGEIDSKKVVEVLEVRSRAAETIPGRAACRLARLDWRYAEGSLLPEADSFRRELFDALEDLLASVDKGKPIEEFSWQIARTLQGLLNKTDESIGKERKDSLGPLAESVEIQAVKSDDPVVRWAERVLRAHEAGSAKFPEDFMQQIRAMLQTTDVDGLRRLYLSISRT